LMLLFTELLFVCFVVCFHDDISTAYT
jgi:hypothetical protein